MPLNTQVIRDGKELKIKWGSFHVAAMVIAAAIDSGKGPWEVNTREGIFKGSSTGEIRITPKDSFNLVSYPVIAMTPLNDTEYTLQNNYQFRDSMDDELFELKAGDVLVAYRN